MKPTDAERYARLARDVARHAAGMALAKFRVSHKATRKSDTELITSADLELDQWLRDALQLHSPEIPVIAEESGGSASGDKVWYVDPIDGTTNFVHGHPFWSVSIGLVVRGVPLAGAVVAPAIGVDWMAWMGGPCLRNDKPCAVSTTRSLADALLATGFPYDRRKGEGDNVAQFSTLLRASIDIRRCGSAAVDLCFVADGTYDGYWERQLRPWDLAAGAAIVLAAGGTVTSYAGEAPDVRSGEIVASNGRIHAQLLRGLHAAAT